jgi:hypothetical protein
MVEMKLIEIADRISAHLARFEADPIINAPAPSRMGSSEGLKKYWHSRARQAGAYVGIVYIAYQGASNISKAEALRYLAWLDAGNVGRHYEALRAKEAP